MASWLIQVHHYLKLFKNIAFSGFKKAHINQVVKEAHSLTKVCKNPLEEKEISLWLINRKKNLSPHSNMTFTAKATRIWKFVQRQSPHLGFRWRYRRILFGYQARIFHFSFASVWHKSLSFITWNLIEHLNTQDVQRVTAHLNVWANTLLCNFSENSGR